jgi:AcrR family transcriptional regulator
LICRREHARGRPRVEGERETEILDATLDLLLEVGYDRLTMDGVASRARASKATLYRRWTAKHSLVIDALMRAKKSPAVPEVDTGTLRADLLATYCSPGGFGHGESAELLAVLMTALHTDADFAAEFRTRFLQPKVEVSRRIYARAQARGEIAPGVDLDLIAPALTGILLHRVFLLGQAVDDRTVEAVIDQIILPAATGRQALATKDSHDH